MVNFSRSVLKILHRAEKIYTGGARGARDKYQVCRGDKRRIRREDRATLPMDAGWMAEFCKCIAGTPLCLTTHFRPQRSIETIASFDQWY